MVIKVGINGFGRVGRVVFRTCLQHSDIEITAINDPAIEIDYISYLIKFDSTHGPLRRDVTHTEKEIKINDSLIKVFHQKEPASIPWKSAGVQYVVEASGMFTNLDRASGHLASDCVRRVILTAPSMDVPMIILGVNDCKMTPDLKVISCGSSTLYCLAPIVKLLEDAFGVEDGFITSIHAMTPSLKPLDGLCIRGKHWRDHRSITQNIIPATTGACKALGKILPEVKDKMTGLAFRVPIVNVSVLDLTIRLTKNTSLEEIALMIDKLSQSEMKNIVRVCREETVSSDYVGDNHSCILDIISSLQLKPNYYKLVCWYENEHSYACRVVDSIKLSDKQFMEKFNVKWVKPQVCSRQNMLQATECSAKQCLIEGKYGLGINPQVVCSLSHAGFKRVNRSPTRPSFLKKPIVTNNFVPNTTNFISHESTQKIEVLKYGCKVWQEDTAVVKSNLRQNRDSFFQACNVFTAKNSSCDCSKAKERLEKVKQEFSKMVDITEDLLRKSYSNKLQFNSAEQQDLNLLKNNVIQTRVSDKPKDFLVSEQHKNLQIAKALFDSSDTCKTSTCTLSNKMYSESSKEDVDSVIYAKEKSDFSMIDSNVGSQNMSRNYLCARSLGSSKVETSNREKLAIHSGNRGQTCKKPDEELGTTYVNRNFKDHVSKTFTTFIDGISRNFSFASNKNTAVNKCSNSKKSLVINNEKSKLEKGDSAIHDEDTSKTLPGNEIDRNLKEPQVPTVHDNRFYENINKANEACISKPDCKNISLPNTSIEKRFAKKDLRQVLLKKNVSCNEDFHDTKYENERSTKDNSKIENVPPDEISTFSKKMKKFQFSRGHKYNESRDKVKGDNIPSEKLDVTKIENELCSIEINKKDVPNKISNDNIVMAESRNDKLSVENSTINENVQQLNDDNNINKNNIEYSKAQCGNTSEPHDNATNIILSNSDESTLNMDLNNSPVTISSQNDYVHMHVLQLKLAEHGDSIFNKKENLSEQNTDDQSVSFLSEDNEVLQDKMKKMADNLHRIKKRFVSFTLEDTFIGNTIKGTVPIDNKNEKDTGVLNNEQSDDLNEHETRTTSSAVNINTISSENFNEIDKKGIKSEMKMTKQIDEVKITRYDRSRSSSILNTITKQDIFDKLDSDSASDSESSLHIDGKKSQVIHITDLTTSLEDLERLDKICRIVEISDELSDKLFSSLDKSQDVGNNITKKKWSFKDLCEKINLDDFCNQVFGK